jgi:hypothetical protein
MPDRFTLGGMEFENLGPAGSLFVNEAGGDRGLQFKPAGVLVRPPAGTSAALVTIGRFSSDVLVEAKDAVGVVLFSQKVQAPNSYTRVLVQCAGMSVIGLTGGGSEGIVAELVVPC